MVCASNQNRSMAAHYECIKKGIKYLTSYGTGSKVRIPSKRQHKPFEYEFGTPYKEMLEDLKREDENYYIKKNMIPMLERNIGIKEAPEKFQESNIESDIVLCFQKRVFEEVVENLMTRTQSGDRCVYVINYEVKDTYKNALDASKFAADFCEGLNNDDDWESNIFGKIETFGNIVGIDVCHLALMV